MQNEIEHPTRILQYVDDAIVFADVGVTAACPYPALRLDKLYAALIRCLVLWTVTKQFLVFRVLKDCIF